MSVWNLNTDDIIYTGTDYPSLGIKNGMKLSKVSEIISKKLNSLDGVVGAVERIQDTVEDMYNYKGNTYNIDRGISLESARLTGAYITYKVDNTKARNTFEYDLRTIDIPSDMTFYSSEVTLSGKSRRGNSIIFESNDRFRKVDVELDRYPLFIDVSVRIMTNEGEVRLVGTKQVTQSYTNKGVIYLDIEDRTGTTINREDFLERLAAKVSEIDNKLLRIKDIEKDLDAAEAQQKIIEDKIDVLETAHPPHTDKDGHIVHPGDKLGGIFGRLQELLKKNS